MNHQLLILGILNGIKPDECHDMTSPGETSSVASEEC